MTLLTSRLIKTLSSLCIAVTFTTGAWASATDDLKAFANSTNSAKGEFTQRVVGRNNKAIQQATGEFAFSRPGKFRWGIKKPYEQLIIADGQQVYMYDKDLAQVTIRPIADAISATPAALLFGQSDVDKLFLIKNAAPKDGFEWLDATPKAKDSPFVKISIGFNDGLPVALEMLDALGQTTLLTLSKWTRNTAGGSDAFKFVTPQGVDVIQSDGLGLPPKAR